MYKNCDGTLDNTRRYSMYSEALRKIYSKGKVRDKIIKEYGEDNKGFGGLTLLKDAIKARHYPSVKFIMNSYWNDKIDYHIWVRTPFYENDVSVFYYIFSEYKLATIFHHKFKREDLVQIGQLLLKRGIRIVAADMVQRNGGKIIAECFEKIIDNKKEHTKILLRAL